MRCPILCWAAATAAAAEPLTYQLPPEQYQRAVEYHRWMNGLHFGGIAWSLLVLAAMVWLRAGPRVSARFRSRFAAAAVLLAIPWAAADLPFAMVRHQVAVRYGLSVQGWVPWFADVAKATAITGVLAVLLLPAAIVVVRRWRRGWLVVWAGTATLMGIAVWAAPVFFDPLFYSFRPLTRVNPELVRALQAVSREAGYDIPESRMFEMDASRTTRAVNAYMTGVGDSRRIVIWDTTLAVLTVPQVQTVFAHEAGHYALHHIPLGIAGGAAGLFLAMWIGQRVLRRRPGHEIPLILLLATGLGFVSEPLANGISRRIEHQADVYELDTMHRLIPNAGRNSAEVDQILSAIDLEDPAPGAFIRFWRYDHPPVAERMEFAQRHVSGVR